MRSGATWTEIFVVLALGVVPDVAYAIHRATSRAAGDDAGWGYSGVDSAAVYLLVRSLQVSLPLLYILRLAHEPLSRFGIVRPRLRDAAWGALIWLAGTLAYYAAWFPTWWVLRSLLPTDWYADIYRSALDPAAPGLRLPGGWMTWGALIVMSAANGFAEELVMRAYLMTRLRQLTRNWVMPLLVSAALFAAYHAYQGAAGVIGSAVIGLVYGAAFIVLRRFWPLAFAHALADVVGWIVTSARATGH
jgi:membrane protease YdiL (CAAX protease family)